MTIFRPVLSPVLLPVVMGVDDPRVGLVVGAAAPQIVDGVAIGEEGAPGTPFEGMIFAYGDDFDALPTFNSGYVPSGKYGHSGSTNNPSQIRRINSSESDAMMYVDPDWRGDRSQSPTPLLKQAMSVADGVLTITASVVQGDQDLVPYLPENYTQGGGSFWRQPRMISGGINSYPDFMFSARGDWVIDSKVKFASGQARGYWPSDWVHAALWPDYGEVDSFEGKKDGSFNTDLITNIIVSNSDGGASVSNTFATTADAPTDRFLWCVVRKEGETLSFYDDSAVEGTLALIGTYSTASRVNRLRGSWQRRMELAVNNWWDSTGWNSADWPKTYQIGHHRTWVPVGSPALRPATVIDTVEVAPGDPWTYTIPSDAAMFGDDVSPDLVEAFAVFYNNDTPGANGSSSANGRLPFGMTVDLGAKTITGTIPSTEGGRVGVRFEASFDTGGPCRRAFLWYNVAPAVQNLFKNKRVNRGGAIDFTVRYDSFHSGDLGPHTITIADDSGGWVSYTGNGGTSVRVQGTAPDADSTVTFTITCANAVGQETVVTRTLEVAADAYNFEAWNGPAWYDPGDSSTVTLSGAAVVGLANKREGGSNLVGRGTTANMVISAAALNGLDVITLTRDISASAAVPALTAAMKDRVSRIFQGDDKPYTVISVYKPTDTNTGFIWSASRTLGSGTNDVDVIGLVRRNGAPGAGVYRRRQAAATLSVDWGSGQAADTWRIVAIKHTGIAASVWDNSLTKVVNASAQNAAAFSNYLRFKLFGFPNAGNDPDLYNLTQCSLQHGPCIIEEGALDDAVIEQAMVDLAEIYDLPMAA